MRMSSLARRQRPLGRRSNGPLGPLVRVPPGDSDLFLGPEPVTAKDAGDDAALGVVAGDFVWPLAADVRVVAEGVHVLAARSRAAAACATRRDCRLAEAHAAREPEASVAQGEFRRGGHRGEPRRRPGSATGAEAGGAREVQAREEPLTSGFSAGVGEVALGFGVGLHLSGLPGPVALGHGVPEGDALGPELSGGNAQRC